MNADTRLGMPPPSGARVLFDGGSLTAWQDQTGGEAAWPVEAQTLTVGRGDILSRELFEDFQLHLEFRCPPMPEAEGQDRANSGVFLQGRYEIQILDSFGIVDPGTGDCGAVYRQHAPLLNACLPPARWQSLDVCFRAAGDSRCARLTAFLNGRLIHNNVPLPSATPGALDEKLDQPGPLRLQDHGDPVAFRHIWLLPLPRRTSGHYQGERREL